MAAHSPTSKLPPVRGRKRMPTAVLIFERGNGSTILLGEEAREVAEAAQSPGAEALEVLQAARAVHQAERALRAATGAGELFRARAVLEDAERALGATLDRLDKDRGSPVEGQAQAPLPG